MLNCWQLNVGRILAINFRRRKELMIKDVRVPCRHGFADTDLSTRHDMKMKVKNEMCYGTAPRYFKVTWSGMARS